MPTTIRSYGDYDKTTASYVTKNDKYLVKYGMYVAGKGDTSFSVVTGVTSTTKRLNTNKYWVIGDTTQTKKAITDISSTSKGLDTTSIFGVSGTGAAVTGVTSTNKRLAVQEIYGVESKGISVSKVTGGSKTINVGATQTTSVVRGLGSTAAAAGNNPFVNATVDADECLSWIEKPLDRTEIREASKQDITVQNLTVEQITGVAKVASDSVTVATGALVNEGATSNVGDVVSIGVTTTTDSFAKKSDKETTVATGSLIDKTDGDVIITSVSSKSSQDFASINNVQYVQVATGKISDNGLGDSIVSDFNCETMGSEHIEYANGRLSDSDWNTETYEYNGDNIADAIVVKDIDGVVVDDGEVSTIDALVPSTQDEFGAIKVLTGITSTAATKNVTLTKGADETHSIDVAITVTPDKRS